MKAAFFEEHGGREVLKVGELAAPEPGPGEARVEVKAFALNHLDIFVRKGWPALKLRMPHICGSDAAGVVESVGPGVSGLSVGDEVVLSAGVSCGRCLQCLRGKENYCRKYHLFGEHRSGAGAELFVAPEGNLLPKPQGLDWAQAASLGVAYLTAWHMLISRAKVTLGDTVLINGASSGVSVAGIQMARLHGARVIASTSSEKKAARARELGASEVIDYTGDDVRSRVKELTGGQGVDVVLEHVGGEVFETSMKCLRTGGRLVLCGATAAPKPRIDLRYVFARHLNVLGATMGTRAELLEVLHWVNERSILPVLDRVISIEEIAEGHRLIEEKQHFGKVVLTL